MNVANPSVAKATGLTSAPITSIQPGGGACMRVELAWGRWRRRLLKRFFPGYVRRMLAVRQGNCPDCPHDVIDSRDLKYFRNVCGYWFRGEDDRFRWRDRLYLARVGLGETVMFSVMAIAACALVTAGLYLGLPDWVGAAAVLAIVLVWLQSVLFFRDPTRSIPDNQRVLVSAADGMVQDVGEVDEPGLGKALRIGVFLSVFNVHVNRAPRPGRVRDVRYYPGRFLLAFHDDAATLNEQLAIDLDDAILGRPIRVKQISGALARRIVCWLKPGDVLAAGQRFGMIKFGSRTEIYVPADVPVEVLVKVGQKVKGGETALLRFPE